MHRIRTMARADEEKAAQEAAGAGSSLANLHAPDVAVPVLSPAPAPRKPGDHVMATSPTVGVASSSAASYSRSAGAGSSSSSSAAGAGGSVASLAARTAASLNLYGSNGDGNSDTVMAGAAAASGSSLTQLSAPSSSSSSAVTPSRPTAGANITSPAAQASAAAAAAAQAAAQAAAAAEANSGEDEYEYEYEEFNPYLFIKLLPPYHTVAPKTPRIVLPKKSKWVARVLCFLCLLARLKLWAIIYSMFLSRPLTYPHHRSPLSIVFLPHPLPPLSCCFHGHRRKAPDVNLVLDLDETLVHCSVDPIPDADVTFPVTFNGMHYMVYVRKRPFLDRFFQSIAGKFEVTVFTASQQVYAERLLNLLDPEGIYIHHRLYRDSCLNVDGNYLKDLNVLGRDLSKTVLVDNSPHAFGYQVRIL